MNRSSVIMYKSVYEAIQLLPEGEQLKAYNAILEYAFTGTEPQPDGAAGAVFLLVKPQIDANNKKFESGCRGGRPSKQQSERQPEANREETAEEPKENQTETKGEPNHNPMSNEKGVYVSSDDDSAQAREVVDFLASNGIVPDCELQHTQTEYAEVLAQLSASPWASANFLHLSKLHRHWDKLRSGFYATAPLSGFLTVCAKTRNPDELNALFADLTPEEI